MKKLLTIILFFPLFVAAQYRELHSGQYTRDTVVKFTGLSNEPTYTLRITSYADTFQRPMFIGMPGDGELGPTAGLDTSNLTKYFFHNLMKSGWDGGIPLGDTVHYPILVTVLVTNSNNYGIYTQEMVDSIRRWYHAKLNSVHLIGLSKGAHTWGRMVAYQKNAADEHAMSLPRSVVLLQGGSPAIDGINTSAGYGPIGHAAVKYGLRLFAIQGSAEGSNLSYPSAKAVKDSLTANGKTNMATFVLENYGGGLHCCWNSFTDTSLNNFLTWSYRVTSGTYPNQAGNYTDGSNIYQWMLRQGDTTVVGQVSNNPSVNAGSDQFITLPTSTATLTATATGNGGHTIASYAWTKVSGPSGGTITSASSASTGITGLNAGVYTYQILVTDNVGGTATGVVNITVTAPLPPTVSAGADKSINLPTSSVSLTGTASGNSGATITSTLWTKVSGPNTPTIVSSASLTTSITGLIQGTYVFRLAATDSNDSTASDDATVTVFGSSSIQRDYPFFGRGEYQWVVVKPDRKLYGISGNGSLNNIGLAGGTVGIVNKIVDSAMFVECASGLHFAGAVDTAGHPWTMGDKTNGQSGDGTSSPGGYNTPTKLLIDSAGNPLQPIDHMTAYFMGNAAAGWWAYREGQTYGYIWGDTRFGSRGDGTLGSSISNRPVLMTLPVAAKKMVCAYHCILLGADSSVWTAGGGNSTGHGQYENLGYKPTSAADTATAYLTWRKIADAGSAIDIAGGMQWDYYLKPDHITLMGSGQFGGYMAAANNSTKYGTPTDLTTNISSKLPAPIAQIVTDHTSTGVLCTDGTYWKWGDNPFGLIGNGQELNFGSQNPPWAYSLNSYLNPVRFPTKVLDGIQHIFPSSAAFLMYDITIDSNGVTRSWGRAKASVLNNGIKSASSNLESDYPQWADVTLPTVMDLSSTSTWITTCQLCLTYPDSLHCPQYSIPANTGPLADAGSDQFISSDHATLDGSGSVDDVHISYYLWSQTSGPVTAKIKHTPDAITDVTGLSEPGVYTFNLKTTDNAWMSSSDAVTIYVNVIPSNPGLIHKSGHKFKFK